MRKDPITSFSVKKETADRLRPFAAADGRTVSNMAERIIEEWLKAKEAKN